VVALVVLISAATIARGTAGYAKTFIALPDAVIAGSFVIVFTAVSCLGVKDSARIAAAMTVVELAGLLLVIGAGAGSLRDLKHDQTELFASDLTGWLKVLSGAFLAFFAFTGFENLANMAEEAKNAARSLPLAILISLGLSTALYVTVALVVVAAVPIEQAVSSPAPLLLVIGPDAQASSRIFSGLALVAVSNGVLIQVLVLARLFYGMARRQLLPSWLTPLNREQVPVRATILAGGLILASTLLLPFHALLHLSTTLTLLLFVQVNLSLCLLHLKNRRPELGFRVPRPLPYIAAFASVALIAVQFLG
jgi:amino acid transporter